MTKRRQLMANSLWILVYRLSQSVGALVLTVAIARILGPHQLGQYTLAFSYYFLFMTLVSSGFKSLFVRELSVHPEETSDCLVSGTLLQLGFGVVGYLLLAAIVSALPHHPDTAKICYILGLAIIPFSLSNVTESIFQAREKMHLATLSTAPVYILRALVSVVMMKLGYHVHVVAWIQVISEVIVVAIEWGFVLRLVRPVWRVNKEFMRRTVRAVSTFLFIDGLSSFQARAQVVILSLLTTETVVGLYGAVVQLTQPFHLIATSLVLANFPALSKSAEAKTDQQRRLTHWLIELLLLMALPLLVGVWFTGPDLLLFIYRNRGFAEAAPALVVVVVGLIGVSFIRPLGYLLVANRLERINMREVIITTIIGTLLSVVLIARFQLMGAALASALIAFISAAQYVYALYTRLFPLNFWRIIPVPLLVSGLMLAVIVVSQQITTETLYLLVISTAFYTLFIGVVGVHALGGPKNVYAALRRSRP